METKLRALIACSVLFGAVPRLAQAGSDAPGEKANRPWAENVTQEQQDQALRLFEEGNKLFEDSQHVAALAKYREALKFWDHPAIRYNTATAQIQLDQPLAAYENLESALRYGEAPFTADNYQQALTYRKLLRGQLAEIKVTCADQNADVTLDGQALFVSPGEATRRLMPGTHLLVARKAGFFPETRSLNLLPGKPYTESLVLQEIGTLPTKTVRRWPAWKPWAVAGGGAVFALLGYGVFLDARSNAAAFDAEVNRSCPTGCKSESISPAALDARDRSRVENVVAASLFAVGGALAVGGTALLILNQPRVVPDESRPRASVIPVVGARAFGLSALVTF